MASLVLAKLTNRSLLKIYGPDCYPYLQGLLCNDLRYLYEPQRIPPRKHVRGTSNVLSTFMLNPQGRAICDMLLYRTPSTRYECKFSPPGQETEPDELLIECDSKLASGLANTLYGYRVRRKISLTSEKNLTVWCLFPHIELNKYSSTELVATEDQAKQLFNYEAREVMSDKFIAVGDPRLTSMGMRIITSTGEFNEVKRSIQSIVDAIIKEGSLKDYTLYRCFLGVGEGLNDHPESNCLPLECNAEQLSSVSFDKGCYLGQELTARIHHTGVVRKRLMPLVLDLESGIKDLGIVPLISGSDIIDVDKKKKLGVLRHVVKNRALGLLRADLIAPNPDGSQQQIIHEGSKTKITAYKPYWWS